MELNKTSSAAQSTVASIDDDVLIEIFLCIPLKPLVRLKLVSKHWNFIISGKNFNLLRSQKNPNLAVGLIFIVIDKLHRPSSYMVSFDKSTNGPLFNNLLEFNSVWPLNSCNGLLLFRRRGNGIDEPKQLMYYVYVCNPTTNKYFMLPKLDKPYFFYRMCLAFDPSKSPHYKVVRVDLRNQLDVYSSETGSWRKHGEPFSADVDFSRGVYWNGAIHWISKTNTGQSLYFNPDNDRMPQVMPTPPMIADIKPELDPSRSCIYHYLGESCGHLHYIQDGKAVMELNVYEMRTDYSEWFLKYRVDCSLIGNNRLASVICALVRGKKDEDSFLVLQSHERIIRYNLANKTCETIYKIPNAACENFYPIYHHRLQYTESLSHV